MSEFLAAAQPILQVIQWLVAIGAFILMLYLRSVFATKADHTELQARVAKLETNDYLFAERMKQGPTANDVHQLQISVEKLTGQVLVSNERMSGLEDLQKVMKRQVDVMDDFLRQHK